MKFPLYFDVKIVHINVLPHLAHWNGKFLGWVSLCGVSNLFLFISVIIQKVSLVCFVYIDYKYSIPNHRGNLPFQCGHCEKDFIK